jgi:hypothetical protein
MDEDIMWAIVAIVIWGPPALALSIRFALKPMAEAIRTMREAQHPTPSQDAAKIAALEAEIARLSRRLDSVESAETFHRELKSGSR